MLIRKELPRPAHPGELVAWDTEFFGQEKDRLHRPHGVFACVSVAYSPEEVYQVYDPHDLPALFERIDAGTWVLHNAVYDLTQIARWVTPSPRPVHDVMIYEQGLWGGYYDSFALADLVRRYFSEQMDKSVRVEFSHATEMSVEQQEYAARDAVDTLRVAQAQLALGRSEMEAVYWGIDAPMIWVVRDMRPVKVDVGRWRDLATEFSAQAQAIEGQLGFNVKSTQQVQRKLSLRGIHVPNTRAETLEVYKDDPLVAQILAARKYRDAVSKYGFNWLEQHVEDGDLVYPQWKIRQAETGRMAAAKPNLQNIPTREMPVFREFFITHAGIMGDWDISQQEPRITCSRSGDKNLLKAFLAQEDIHTYVAREIYGDPTIHKGDPRRQVGKGINLGLTYGLTAKGLADRTGLSEQEAENIIRRYFDRFPGVENYITRMRTVALQRGYVTTQLGARLWINPYGRSWQNNAINAPIQGGAAEFTKRWMLLTWEMERSAGLPFTIVAPIHDETLHDIERDYKDQVEQIVHAAFQQTATEQYPGIPFEIEGGFGDNWRAAHPG